MRTREEAAGDPGILLGRVATRWVAYGCWVVASWAAVTGVGCGGSGGSPTVPGPVVSPAPEPPPPDPPEAPSPGVVVTPEELFLTEGATTTLGVRLATPPAAAVTVAVSVQVHAVVFHEFLGKEPPLSLIQGSRLTFDADSWDADQKVTVVAAEDFDTSDEELSIYVDTTSDDPIYEALARRVIPARVADDDPHRFNIVEYGQFWHSPPEGITWSYAVALSGMPTGEVIVEVTSGDPGAVVVADGAVLLFTPDDFYVPQPFRLSGVTGRTIGGTVIRLAAIGGGYDGLSSDFTLSASGEENWVVLSDEEVFLTEGGTGEFSVRPGIEPDPETRVTVFSYNPDALTISGGQTSEWFSTAYDGLREVNSRSLTFTPEDWRIAQEVTLEAHQDDDTDDEQFVIFLNARKVVGPNHTSYIRAGWDVRGILVTVYDDDTQ